MNLIKKILPHICIILSGMIVTFFIISQFNNAMGLMENDMTKAIIFILGIVAIIVSSMLISKQRREN